MGIIYQFNHLDNVRAGVSTVVVGWEAAALQAVGYQMSRIQ